MYQTRKTPKKYKSLVYSPTSAMGKAIEHKNRIDAISTRYTAIGMLVTILVAVSVMVLSYLIN